MHLVDNYSLPNENKKIILDHSTMCENFSLNRVLSKKSLILFLVGGGVD